VGNSDSASRQFSLFKW